MDKTYRILVINPGSTSTKLSMFENETCLFTEDVFHDSSVLKQFPTINDQLDYRMEVVDKFLKDGNIVNLDDFGSFSLNGSFCEDKEPGEHHRAESIEVKNVVFKAEKRLKKAITAAGFEKYNPGRHNKRKY